MDSISLATCGFVLVAAMMAYWVVTDGRLPKEIQKGLGYLLLICIAFALVRASNGFQRTIRKSKLKIER